MGFVIIIAAAYGSGSQTVAQGLPSVLEVKAKSENK